MPDLKVCRIEYLNLLNLFEANWLICNLVSTSQVIFIVVWKHVSTTGIWYPGDPPSLVNTVKFYIWKIMRKIIAIVNLQGVQFQKFDVSMYQISYITDFLNFYGGSSFTPWMASYVPIFSFLSSKLFELWL